MNQKHTLLCCGNNCMSLGTLLKTSVSWYLLASSTNASFNVTTEKKNAYKIQKHWGSLWSQIIQNGAQS